jgi:hypothetical protein
MMANSIERAPWIIRIWHQGQTSLGNTEDSEVVGAGFLISERYLLTCAHVVNHALDRPADEAEVPTLPVMVDFPLLQEGSSSTRRYLARVVAGTWLPEGRDREGDIAVLELENDPPLGVLPPKILSSSGTWGHGFRALGFPVGHNQGEWARGELLGPVATGWVQLDAIRVRGRSVGQGFSGTPVWDEELGAVIGMVVGQDRDLHAGIAFMIPTEILAQAWSPLATQLQTETSTLGRLHNVPMLPAHFVNRPNELATVRTTLIRAVESPGNSARPIGLVGMGGAGKSVIARVLVREKRVRSLFPDGVFWLELTKGPDEDVRARQEQIAMALGAPPPRAFIDEQEGRGWLSDLLAKKACLLILDNLRRPEDLGNFLHALGDRCRLLVTTRYGDLVSNAGGAVCPVDALPDNEALLLLAKWSGRDDPSSLPPEARRIIKEVGNLPLALAIAGAMTSGQLEAWQRVLERLRTADLNRLQRKFPDYPYPTLLRALEVSVEDLEPEQRARYLELAVFARQGPIPEAAVHRMWAAQGLDQLESQELIALLVDRSLVQRELGARELRLHDLQADYLIGKLGHTPTRELHSNLAEAYLNAWGGLGAGLPDLWRADRRGLDEGYGLKHVVSHLAKAGRTDDIHTLLAVGWELGAEANLPRRPANAWYLAHETAGDTAGYLADVELAWRLTQNQLEEEVAAGRPQESLGLQLRYALFSASVNSLASNLPPSLVVALVKYGSWTPPQGFAFAIRMPDSAARHETLVSLFPYLTVTLQREMLTVTRQNMSGHERVQTLSLLLPHVPESLLGEALQTVLSFQSFMGIGQDETLEMDVLRSLAARSPQGLLADALEASQRVVNRRGRSILVKCIAPHLAEPLQRRALSMFLAGTRVSAELAEELAPYLSEPLLNEAVQLTERLPVEERVRTLTVLLPHLPEAQQAAMAATALRQLSFVQSQTAATPPGSESAVRAWILGRIAPYLSEPLLNEAVQLTERLPVEERVRTLTVLLPHLPEAQQAAMAATALRLLPELAVWPKANVLRNLIPYLPSSYLQKALEAVKRLTNGLEQASVLEVLAPRLHRSLLIEAYHEVGVDASSELGFKGLGRPQVLEVLVPHLPDSVIPELLQEFNPNDWLRGDHFLRVIVPRLPPAVREEILRLIPRLAHDFHRAKILSVLIPYFPLDQLLDLAIKEFRQIVGLRQASNKQYGFELEPLAGGARMLDALGPHLTELLLERSLTLVDTLESEYQKAKFIEVLLPYLSKPQFDRALHAFHEVANRLTEAEALQFLSPHRYDPRNRELIVGEERNQRDGLSILAPHLPDAVLTKALIAARRLRSRSHFLKIVATLYPFLPEPSKGTQADTANALRDPISPAHPSSLPAIFDVLGEALRAAQFIGDSRARAWLLRALGPDLPKERLSDALLLAARFEDGLRVAGETSASPFNSFLEDPDEFADGTNRTRIFAVIAERLPQAFLNPVLKTIGAFEYPFEAVHILEVLAPLLPEVLFETAIEEAAKLDGDIWRASALAVLAPHIPPSAVNSALHMALRLDKDSQMQVLPRLALRLPEDKRSLVAIKVLQLLPTAKGFLASIGINDHVWALPKALAVQSVGAAETAREGRDVTLGSFVLQHLPQSLFDRARTEGASRAYALRVLTPYLPKHLLAKTIRVVEGSPEELQGQLLKVLAPHLPESLVRLEYRVSRSRRGKYRVRWITALAPYVPEEFIEDGLRIAKGLREGGCAQVLTAFVSRLSEPQRSETVGEVVALLPSLHPADRSELLRRLAPYITPPLQAKALELLRERQNEQLAAGFGGIKVDQWVASLEALAPHLPETLMKVALSVVEERLRGWGEINRASMVQGLLGPLEGKDRAPLLEALVPYLPDALLDTAFRLAEDYFGAWDRGRLLEALASRLPEEFIARALGWINEFPNEHDRVWILEALVPCLPDRLLDDALATIHNLGSHSQARLLPAFAVRVRDTSWRNELAAEALMSVLSLEDFKARQRGLTILKALLSDVLADNPMWQPILATAATRTRAEMCWDLAQLVPTIAAQGGSKAIAGTFDALTMAGDWWP